MANKASKQLARANTTSLNRTHAITVSLHIIFILYRLLFRHGSWIKYTLLSLPSLIIEYYLERLGRPSYTATGDLKSPGEDMEAKGVTEYLWDIVYVTWVVLGLVGVAGEWAWWLWVSAPPKGILNLPFDIGLIGGGMKNGMMPGMPSAPEGPPSSTTISGAQSNRQKKAEKRGGQKTRYQ